MKFPAIRLNPLGVLILCTCILFFTFVNLSSWYKRHKRESVVSLKRLLAVGISVAEIGGARVREVRLNSNLEVQSKGETKEGANIPLTAGDILSHRSMMYCLQDYFPHITVISEERDDHTIGRLREKLPLPKWNAIDKVTDDIEIPAKDVVIWIDPLDATQEYTENLLEYVTTMVCVAVKGIPVIGIIHQPFKNETAWAWAGHGVSHLEIEGPKIKMYGEKVQQIIVSRSHAGKVGEVAKAAFGPKSRIISAGGAGYKSLRVATGKADAYIHVTAIKKWDICAGNALLNALGGQMTTLKGTVLDYGEFSDFTNNEGLVATLHNQKHYVEKLSSLRN